MVFVRHAVARTPEPGAVARLGAVQAELNEMMAWAACPVVNPPASAYSNYAKAYQLGLLAEAGFAVPVTLLTNSPGAARDFADALPGPAIYKGSSNVVTLAQVLTPERRARLAHLPNAPAVFQEFVRGPDLRVHVIGERCFATRLEADDEDYRRAALRGGEAAVRAAVRSAVGSGPALRRGDEGARAAHQRHRLQARRGRPRGRPRTQPVSSSDILRASRQATDHGCAGRILE